MKTNGNLVIFLGPPGSGKGSLSQLCVQKLGWTQLSTGSLCRKHISEKTELGKRIDFFIKSGKLIDDESIVAMVDEWLVENSSHALGIILDGFPRTLAQAEILQKLIETKLPHSKLKVFKLVVPDETIVHRLMGRFVCSNKDCQTVYSAYENSAMAPKENNICDKCGFELIRRSDDDMKAIKERLNIYHNYEQYLINFYTDKGQDVVHMDVDKPLEKVFEEFTYLIAENR